MGRILPILFNTERVIDIMEDRKSATRRSIKYKAADGTTKPIPNDARYTGRNLDYFVFETDGAMYHVKPPCEVGDTLYVRESVFQGVGHYLDVSGETVSVLTHDYEYYADGLHEKDHWKDKHERTWMHRRPSMHMPKEAARIFLKVKGVRVEHLQDMNFNDFLKEGVCVPDEAFNDTENAYGFARHYFIGMWTETIKVEDNDLYGWNADPYVWVIEFERCEKPTDWR